MTNLERRIEKLERQNKLMKRFGGLVVVMLAAFVLMGQVAEKTPWHLMQSVPNPDDS